MLHALGLIIREVLPIAFLSAGNKTEAVTLQRLSKEVKIQEIRDILDVMGNVFPKFVPLRETRNMIAHLEAENPKEFYQAAWKMIECVPARKPDTESRLYMLQHSKVS